MRTTRLFGRKPKLAGPSSNPRSLGTAPAVRDHPYCSKGGDPHPTGAGYRAMADAFMAASGYPRK